MCPYASFFPAIFFLPILLVFYFRISAVFFYFLYSFAKMKAYTVCATAQASIFTVFWAFVVKEIAKLLIMKTSER